MPRARTSIPPSAPHAVRRASRAAHTRVVTAAPPHRLDLALASLAVLASIVVYRGALAYFFAQDDFTGLARARGLVAPVAFPWRWLSGQAYFVVMRSLADL